MKIIKQVKIIKIISGGQTGVDRASLDVAIELGIDPEEIGLADTDGIEEPDMENEDA